MIKRYISIFSVLLLISTVSCGIRPVSDPNREVVGSLDSESRIELVSDDPESASPVTVPDTGAPSVTAPPINYPETQYGEETSAETDPYGEGSLPDLSLKWAFQEVFPEHKLKFTQPENYFSDELTYAQMAVIEGRVLDNDIYTSPFRFEIPMKDAWGNTATVLYMSVLADASYVEENTVGFYLIQNKGNGYYLSAAAVDYYVEHPDKYTGSVHGVGLIKQNVADTTCAGAQIIRVVRLRNGAYGLLFTYYQKFQKEEYVSTNYCASLFANENGQILSGSGGLITYLNESWIIQKTDSGAFRMTTQYLDSHIMSESVINAQGKYETVTYYATLSDNGACNKHGECRFIKASSPYTNDDDYSDEWLFIPVKGSPEFNP